MKLWIGPESRESYTIRVIHFEWNPMAANQSMNDRSRRNDRARYRSGSPLASKMARVRGKSGGSGRMRSHSRRAKYSASRIISL